MQPLINLKQFLAVLLLLIIPAVLLTAYFRNYQPETGGAGRQHADAAGIHPAGGHGDMAKPGGTGDEHGAKTGGDDHAKMGHAKQGEGSAQPGGTPSPDAKQLEASRAQLEASRAQLDASRQALEAAKEQTKPQTAEPTPAAQPQAKPAASKQGGAPDGHAHQH